MWAVIRPTTAQSQDEKSRLSQQVEKSSAARLLNRIPPTRSIRDVETLELSEPIKKQESVIFTEERRE